NHMNMEFDTDQLRGRSIRGAAVTFVAQLLKFVLTIASQIVLSRLLGPAELGLLAMVAPVQGVVQLLADFGLLQAVVERPAITETQLNGIFWINIGLGDVLTVILVLFAPVLAWMYGDPRIFSITVALACLVMVAALGMVPTALLNRRM